MGRSSDSDVVKYGSAAPVTFMVPAKDIHSCEIAHACSVLCDKFILSVENILISV